MERKIKIREETMFRLKQNIGVLSLEDGDKVPGFWVALY